MKRFLPLIFAFLLCLASCTAPQNTPEPPAPEILPTEQSPEAEPEPEEPPAEKTILFLAGLKISDQLQALVNRFNQSSDRWQIATTDYAFSTDDLSIGRTTMHTKLLARQGPDMIYFSYVDYMENHTMALDPLPCIGKGFLLDMDPLLEADPDISPEDIGPWKALHEYGGLYLLSPQYDFSTLYGTEAKFGGRTGWTIREYLDMEASLNEDILMTYAMTPEFFLEEIGCRYIRSAMDLQNAVCGFDNPEFTALLEAAKNARQWEQNKQDEADLADGSFVFAGDRIGQGSLLTLTSRANPGDILFNRWRAGNIPLTYMGWPTTDGSCGSDLMLTMPVGICAQTEHAEGCWEFMKFLLLNPPMSEANQANPTYTPLFPDLLKTAYQPPEEGYKLTQDDVDVVLNLAEASEHMYFYDEAVMAILQEEASYFLNGDTTAQEVARKVQDRASLYMAEQYG